MEDRKISTPHAMLLQPMKSLQISNMYNIHVHIHVKEKTRL